MDDSPRPRSAIFRFGSIQSHLDASKLANNILSPNSGGTGSPCTRGKTMREFEAELGDLRQENFELKMKIYVLEEQKEALEDVRDVSELRLNNQQLVKELDRVKAELAEKEDLIFKAGEAMMLMGKKHEDDISLLRTQAVEEVETYKTTISRLEQEIIELKEKSMVVPRPSVFEESSAMYAFAFNLQGAKSNNNVTSALEDDRTSELEAKVLELEEQLRVKTLEILDLTAISSTMKLEVDKLRHIEADLKNELEFRVNKLSEALNSLANSEREVQELKYKLLDSSRNRKDEPQRTSSEFQHLQHQYVASKQENHKLQQQVLKLHQRITDLEKYNAVDLHKKIDSLINENSELQDKIRNLKIDEGTDASSFSSKGAVEDCGDNRIRELEKELKETKAELLDVKNERQKTLKAIQAFMKQNVALTRDIERLQNNKPNEKGDQAAETKREGMAAEAVLNSEDYTRKELDTENDDLEKSYLYSALETKSKQVEQLKEKLRKRTFDLQELVNKELWSKNKEIEKLNRACEKQVRDWTDQRTKIKSQEAEIVSLKQEIEHLKQQVFDNCSEQDLLQNDKPSLEDCGHTSELETLKSKLEAQIEQNKHLNTRCEVLKMEAEASEKSRKDLFNACCLLTTRLEELSSFLESLLPSLAGRKRRLVKEAIDMSREVSKSLSLSCLEESSIMCKSIEPILPDVSQVDFNSEEDLDDTLLHSSEAVEDQNNEVLKLRSQMDTLVKRLKETSPEKKQQSLKRNQLSPWSMSSTLQEQITFSPQNLDESSLFANCIPGIALEDITEGTGIESFDTDTDSIPMDVSMIEHKREITTLCPPGSESEGWSEPDRTVSMARIGLKEETPCPIRESGSDSSESPIKSSNSTGKKRRESEIKSLHLKIRSLEMTIDKLVSDKKSGDDQITLTNNTSVDTQLLGESTLTQNLMAEIRDQREKLMLSLNHNDFIRQRLEEVLSSVPSSPTKLSMSDNEKTKSYKQNLLQQVINMNDKLEESCTLCVELEAKCLETEKEKLNLVQLLSESEKKANALSVELNSLKCVLKEKENDLLEKQCSLLELENQIIILESKVKLSQEEAQNKSRLLESLAAENNAQIKELSEKWDKERAKLIDCHDKEISNLKIKIKELEVECRTALSNVENVRGEKDIMESEYKILLDKMEREKRDVIDRESQKRFEMEERLANSLDVQTDLKLRLDAEISKVAEIEANQKLSDRAWRRRLALVENSGTETEARLRRKLDQLTLSNSDAVIERTRLANERLVLQREHAQMKSDFERKVNELEFANRELETRLTFITKADSAPTSPRTDLKRQRSNPTSDYTSDQEHHNIWFPVCGRSNNNSSPDLGIESDNRMSSLEQPLPSSKPNDELCIKPEKLEIENNELRAQLARTRQALEETLAQLSSANQKKRQVEKAICRQLHKTHDILQKARLNLEPSDKHH